MLALPAIVVTPLDPQVGLALALGVIPAGTTPLTPQRRGRVVSLLIGGICGAALFVGSVLGQWPVLAVLGLSALSVGASLASTRGGPWLLAPTMALPLVGIGFSESAARGFAAGCLLVVGAGYAYAVSLLWPERPARARPPQLPPASRAAALDYGIRLGCAGAIAAALGFAFDVDHKGWMCGAALMVMRPDTDLLLRRSVGRAGSVLVGSLAGSALMLASPTPAVLAAVVAVAVAGVTTTQGSRWYVTPGFTTFVLFLLLLVGHPDDTTWRFLQRNLQTLGGVTLALLFGVAVPVLRGRMLARR